MWSAREREEAHTELWWGNLKERDFVDDLTIEGRIILKWAVK
jgi:hypothetical protein